MTRIEVIHLLDDTVRHHVIEAEGPVDAKILPDGRGYVKVRGREVIYRHVEVIDIDDQGGAR